ncbi:uncharacterized protein LOC106872907 [Octopus bimaculoides]|uniref:Chitin-binding type-2 domain-containing protein n=1 Tax=Octopus bimaculoides TaxID=37653 RepID=A0A0L8H5J8_OCTBM|nr:uncharacterized protein LOC106872907 [Octopus bimaculoides]|eukprot:XP_014775569.1 PREDICTED: uncharacterized protein LOC106872907 [Octopus bimaculoides]
MFPLRNIPCIFVLFWNMFHVINANFNCPKPYGYFRDPNNCTVFYRCVNSYPYFFTCQTGAVFDEIHDICTWPINVPECLTDDQHVTTTLPPETIRPTRSSIGKKIVTDSIVLEIPSDYISDESQCKFIQLTLNVILQALVQGSSVTKCPDGICAVPRIEVVCNTDYK